MALAEGILQVIEDAARSHQLQRVSQVRLEVGRLAGVELEALRFCFDVVIKDSVADGAALEILSPPGQGWCLHCSQTVEIGALFDSCPRCGGYQVQATGGTDLRVVDLRGV